MDQTLDAAMDCDEMIDSIVGRELSAGAGTSPLSRLRHVVTAGDDSAATSYWLLILFVHI